MWRSSGMLVSALLKALLILPGRISCWLKESVMPRLTKSWKQASHVERSFFCYITEILHFLICVVSSLWQLRSSFLWVSLVLPSSTLRDRRSFRLPLDHGSSTKFLKVGCYLFILVHFRSLFCYYDLYFAWILNRRNWNRIHHWVIRWVPLRKDSVVPYTVCNLSSKNHFPLFTTLLLLLV